MISVIVVYNNKRSFNGILLRSLNKQTAKFELIAIDNTSGRFRSAAEALNYGGARAKGKYIMFVHQDIEFDADSWFERVEPILDSISELGVAGVAGMSEAGKNDRERGRGYISSGGEPWPWGRAVEKPEVVQTLDECLLVVPRHVFRRVNFDQKTFDSWHAYGADYCLAISEMGLHAYVIPAFVYHRSMGTNIRDLLEYHRRLLKKHRKKYKRIFTPSGEISWFKLQLHRLREFIRPYYRRIFPRRDELLKETLFGCDLLLDLGCGYGSPIRYYDARSSVGVELDDANLDESKKKGVHSQYVKADVTNIEFANRSFDAVLCLDVVEYLTKRGASKLIRRMEKWAGKLVAISTPNSSLLKEEHREKLLQMHKSSWNARELSGLGFKVFGTGGYGKLRKIGGELKYKPRFFWKVVLELSQKISYRCPEVAYGLFCVKRTVQ